MQGKSKGNMIGRTWEHGLRSLALPFQGNELADLASNKTESGEQTTSQKLLDAGRGKDSIWTNGASVRGTAAARPRKKAKAEIPLSRKEHAGSRRFRLEAPHPATPRPPGRDETGSFRATVVNSILLRGKLGVVSKRR